MSQPILETVARYYSEKLRQFGPVAAGVDWKTFESQQLRFEKLLELIDGRNRFSILDYGCGYGALVDFLQAAGRDFDYTGFDISADMIARANELHGDPRCRFTADSAALSQVDYTVASGIFNVKLTHSEEAWRAYILETLHRLDSVSGRGFSFNMLTIYSDVDRRRGDLFYGDPGFYFDYCKRHLSPRVALLHDYPLFEFTILVRK